MTRPSPRDMTTWPLRPMIAPAVFAAICGSILTYPRRALPLSIFPEVEVTLRPMAWPMAHPTNPEQSAASAALFL